MFPSYGDSTPARHLRAVVGEAKRNRSVDRGRHRIVTILARRAAMPRPPPTATASAQPWSSLTGRDLEALQHLAAGRSTAAIAEAMSISTNTVRGHIHRLQN